ncbi:MAG: chemotaxis protein CheA [Lachnospiraceae bacterium]
MDEFQANMFDVFAYETSDFLVRLEDILLQNEQASELPADQVHEIFRIMHTIKSSSAMMGFTGISTLSHRMENLFQFIRDFQPDSVDMGEITDMLFSCIDYMKQCLDQKEELEAPGQLMEAIPACLERMKNGEVNPDSSCVVRVLFDEDCDNTTLRAFELITRIKKIAVPIAIEPKEGSEQEEEILRALGLELTFSTDEAVREIQEFIEMQPFVTEAKNQSQEPESSDEAIVQSTSGQKESVPRGDGILGVDNKKLESLINISGETIISFQEVAHLYENEQWEELGVAIQNMRRFVLEIQDRALSLRMITLNDTFQTLKRSLRDMAKDLGREIRFTISGEDLSMDKNMVQHLSSPLLHILRNAVEHGVEPVAERVAAGKKEFGTIHLSASLSGKSAVITIEDDGKGIHPEKILETALKKNLITSEQIPELSTEEIYAFLLAPGFSTKETISEYSGRGVGLDVVNDNLHKIGGQLQIISVPSQGSRFVLKIPLTLATVDAFLVRISGEIYTIPVGSVQEVFRTEIQNIRQVNGRDSALFRDSCYAIWCLNDKPADRQAYTDGIMMIMEHDNLPYVLFVDEIIDHQNVVVKPVPDLFMQVSGVLGCTVLGNGQISLIIDDVIQLKSRRIVE